MDHDAGEQARRLRRPGRSDGASAISRPVAEARLADQQVRARVGQDRRQLGGGEAPVERQQRRADAPAGKEQLRHLAPVPRQRRHDAAAPDAAARAARRPSGPPPRRAARTSAARRARGPPAPRGPGRRAARSAAGPGGGEREAGASVARVREEEAQHLAAGVGAARVGVGALGRSAGPRVAQPLDHPQLRRRAEPVLHHGQAADLLPRCAGSPWRPPRRPTATRAGARSPGSPPRPRRRERRSSAASRGRRRGGWHARAPPARPGSPGRCAWRRARWPGRARRRTGFRNARRRPRTGRDTPPRC